MMQPPERPTFDPYAPPQAPIGPYATGLQGPGMAPRVEGDLVTIAKQYWWPPVCLKCGTPADLVSRVQSFTWYPAWTNLLLLVGLLPAVIVQAILTKRASLNLPLCSACNARWTKARTLRVLGFIVPLFGGLGLITLGLVFAKEAGIIAVLGFLVFFPGVLVVIPIEYLIVRPRTLRAMFIDDYVVTLKGISRPVLEGIRRG
jgi:hypothetical protein